MKPIFNAARYSSRLRTAAKYGGIDAPCTPFPFRGGIEGGVDIDSVKSKRYTNSTMNEDKIIEKLIEHDAKFETLATQDELARLREEVLSGQDAMMTILKRLDDERVVQRRRVEKLEDDVDRIKVTLKMA